MLDKIDAMDRKTLEAARDSPQDDRQTLELADSSLHMQIDLLRSSLTGTLHKSQYLAKRAQAQVQNVCGSPCHHHA